MLQNATEGGGGALMLWGLGVEGMARGLASYECLTT